MSDNGRVTAPPAGGGGLISECLPPRDCGRRRRDGRTDGGLAKGCMRAHTRRGEGPRLTRTCVRAQVHATHPALRAALARGCAAGPCRARRAEGGIDAERRMTQVA